MDLNLNIVSSFKREIPQELLRHSTQGEVHVDMEDRRHEEYIKPKPVVKAFSGEGRKLGRYLRITLLITNNENIGPIKCLVHFQTQICYINNDLVIHRQVKTSDIISRRFGDFML